MYRIFITFLFTVALSTAALAQSTDPVEIEIFTGEELSFGEAYEEVTVDLPADGNWTRVVLTTAYDAGIGSKRDPWDRIAATQIVLPNGELVEIMRDITDYGFTTVHSRDLTRFLPLLEGQVTFRMYLTSWTSGIWNVRQILTYYQEGNANERADVVVPITGMDGYENNADPGGPYEKTYKMTLPGGLTRLQLYGHATGHTQEEEFGPRRRITISIDGTPVGSVAPWQTNCDHCDNHGTTFNRSGWCPGRSVPFILLTTTDPALIGPGDHNVTIAFDGLRKRWEVGLLAAGFRDQPTPTPTVTPSVTATPTPTPSPTPGQPPTMSAIAAAGYVNSDVAAGQASSLLFWCFTGAAGGTNVQRVEVHYNGYPTGLILDTVDPDVFQLLLPLGAGDLRQPGTLELEFVPIGLDGTPGRSWPYLHIE